MILLPMVFALTPSWPAAIPSVRALDNCDGIRSALVKLGDLNGDGVCDFAVAHRPRPFLLGQRPSAEAPLLQQLPLIWVLSGKDGSVLATIQGPGFDPQAYELRGARAGEGAKMYQGGTFGSTLVAAGDVDGDGKLDLAIGEGRVASPKPCVILASASDGRVIETFSAPEGSRGFGSSLAGGHDVVGDDQPDLAIADGSGVWIVDGASLKPLELIVPGDRGVERLPASGWSIPEALPKVNETLGARPNKVPEVHFLADMGGDGVAEILIARGALDGNSPGVGEGHAYVLFSDPERSNLKLDTEAWCAAGGVDLDGDKRADLITTTVNHAMQAWSSVSGKMLWEINWDGGYMHAQGTSLSWAEDRDRDGVRDLWVGSNETFLDADTGSSFLISAKTGEGQRVPKGDRVGLLLQGGGQDVTTLGDLDGDGLHELAVYFPVAQAVRVLKGSDRSVMWSRQVDALEVR